MSVERFFPRGNGSRDGGRRRDGEKKMRKRIKNHYIDVQLPHKRCKHFVLQSCIRKKYRGLRDERGKGNAMKERN